MDLMLKEMTITLYLRSNNYPVEQAQFLNGRNVEKIRIGNVRLASNQRLLIPHDNKKQQKTKETIKEAKRVFYFE